MSNFEKCLKIAMQCYGCWRAFNHFDPIRYHHRKCPTRQSSVSRDLSSQSLIAHVIVMSCTERPDNNDPLVYCGFNVYFPLLLLCEQKFIVRLDIFLDFLLVTSENCAQLFRTWKVQISQCDALFWWLLNANKWTINVKNGKIFDDYHNSF